MAVARPKHGVAQSLFNEDPQEGSSAFDDFEPQES